jgi:hypothetical protein
MGFSCQKGKRIPIIQLVMILNGAFRGSQGSYLPNYCEFIYYGDHLPRNKTRLVVILR